MVLSWYGHGTVMVRSWYGHGTVMVQPQQLLAATLAPVQGSTGGGVDSYAVMDRINVLIN